MSKIKALGFSYLCRLLVVHLEKINFYASVSPSVKRGKDRTLPQG